MISVKFRRERKDLLIRAVYVAGERLIFDDHDVAHKNLEEGSVCDIHWQIAGPEKAELVVFKTVRDVETEIVRVAVPESGRNSDFTLFRV